MAQRHSLSEFFPFRLVAMWSTGETLEADIGHLLHRIPALAPLLDPDTFAKEQAA